MVPKIHVAQLGVKGRLVVPQSVRSRLHVQEGDTLLFIEEQGGVRVTTRAALIEELAGSLAEDDGRDFTEELLQERREEARREKGEV